MPEVDARSGGEVSIFTFKDGLLSAAAHDLELALERFSIEWSRERVTATFAPQSLRVRCARVLGRPAPNVLSARDRAAIEQTIANEVLDVARYPEARFESSSISVEGEGFFVRGHLTLVGQTREIGANVLRKGQRYLTELTLDQGSFGIKPYTAMLGTLRIKPEVRVRLSVPA